MAKRSETARASLDVSCVSRLALSKVPSCFGAFQVVFLKAFVKFVVLRASCSRRLS